MRSLRVRHDWTTSLCLFTVMHWRRKWHPTPVFLPGESQGRGSLVGCRLRGRTESDTTGATQQQQQQQLICLCYSLSLPLYLSPLLCPKVHSRWLHLYSFLADQFISTTFLDSVDIIFHSNRYHINMWYIFFSFWHASPCMTDSGSIHIITNEWILFIFMEE